VDGCDREQIRGSKGIMHFQINEITILSFFIFSEVQEEVYKRLKLVLKLFVVCYLSYIAQVSGALSI